MAKKVILSLCCLVLLLMGSWQLFNLLSFARTEGRIEAVTPWRKTYLAQIRYRLADGSERSGQVNAEGHQVGEFIPLMYNPADPEGSVTAYSPVLYLIPLICFGGALPLLWLLWAGRLPQAKSA